jgi:diguanylate cyclase (GGDEF)-like protein
MTTVDSAAARLLSPLSTLLRRPLYLADAQSPEATNAFAVRIAMPRIAVIAADGTPFSEEERRVIHELLDVVRIAEESEARYEELELRMMSMTRENLDLTVKNRMLSEVSSRDALTGLYNRGYVVEKLDSELNRSIRHGSPMALLMLDIDHFKTINDTFGHGIGDEVLKSVGKLLRESCRVYDIPGRYGGEEFCILLPETQLGNTTVVAERIRARLETAGMCFGDAAVTVTASIGIAGFESMLADGALSPAALIDRADRALYAAKNRGRNRVEMWAGGGEINH